MGSSNIPQFVSSWSSLQDMLTHRAGTGNSRLLFYHLGNISKPSEISYQSLEIQAKQNSSVIRSLRDFKVGQPVIIHVDNHWDAILWFWSVLYANGLPVLTSPFSNIEQHRQKHIQSLSELLESPICIVRTDSLHLFEGSRGLKTHTIESLVIAQGSQGYGGSKCQLTYGLGPAALMLTSGSTGTPKAVPLTHNQIFKAITGKASVRPLPSDRPFMNWIGLDHVASLVEIHLQAMYLDVDQVQVHAANVVSSPINFLDLLSHHRVSRSFAPNFFLAKLVSAARSATEHTTATWDLSNLAILASGGEANDVKTCIEASDLLEKYGSPRNVITPGFGMTETCAGAIFNLECPDYDVFNGYKSASVGKCMEGIKMRVTTSTGESLPSRTLAVPNQSGHLEVRGEVVFDGYYRNPYATKEAFTSDGWFRTGDKASIDINGNLNLIGRAQDIINIKGIKFLAADIQALIEQALGNRVDRLVSFPSWTGSTEQVTVAYIPREWPIPPKDAMELDNLVIHACIACTGSRPFAFSLGKESLALLPTSALGKISRTKIRSLFEANMFSDDVKMHRKILEAFESSNQSEIRHGCMSEAEASYIDDFSKTSGITTDLINVDTSIFDLGFTSMDLIRLKHRIDNRLLKSIPVITLMKNPTAKSLAVAFNTESSKVLTTDNYDPVVTFRSSGKKTPLWLVHPGVGEVLVFVGLSQHLADDDRPIYALRARGFEPGQKRFDSISEAVDIYAMAIQKRQLHGPYALAGYSYGTMLAFEIAKKLEDKHGPGIVRFLGSFNLPPHIKQRMRQLNWNVCLLHLTYFLSLITEEYADSIDEKGFCTVPRSEALAQILGVANDVRLQELGIDEQGLASWADVAYGLQSMAADYDPEGKVQVIDIFHAMPLKIAAASKEEWVGNQLSKWGNFCRTRPRFHEVGGAHYTMIGPDHVLQFSVTLKAALKARAA
jgi:acyl-CoA synthetase (AMP-forming)/AMP-acid ligase II/thioesterase domain-containing protein